MTNAQITWVEAMQFVARADTGHAIVMDASEESGGFGSASGPMEVLLMGILGCTAMDVISILKKKRQPLAGFKIFATGERAPETQRPTRPSTLSTWLTARSSPWHWRAPIQLSEEKYCGAMATVRGVAKLTSSYRVEPAAATGSAG